ncbi:glycerol-3-phosphate responsive antiterminator [Ktedonosporobacter rubrisoli]|nr:glycerol-3-phosphate responsive antiterminator [Ktedonosporobacter rubrisoli]
MLVRQIQLLPDRLAQHKTIPIVENRLQFMQVLRLQQVNSILLRHCDLFDFTPLLGQAHQRSLAIYINVDQLDGIYPDEAGLGLLAQYFHVAGIMSNNPRILALGKAIGLETIQRMFAVDSTGLETALQSVVAQHVDMLNISPAPVIPYVIKSLSRPLPVPFIGSGLLQTRQQLQAVLDAGAAGIAVARSELWR